jgi:hypothetical protein
MMRARGTGVKARLAALVLTIGIAVAGATPIMSLAARQEAGSAPVEIGAGPVREQAFALVGRTVYGDESARVFGYLTDIIGLDPALVSTDALPTVQTARVTYAGDIPLESRSSRGDVTEIAGAGTITIFYDEDAGADWDDPESFADGEPLAELSLDLRDTLQRQAPAVGVVVGDARYRQESAGELVIADESYRFGQTGIEGRLRTVGALIGGTDEPELIVGLSGSGSVTARETIPVIPGETGA